MTTFILPAPVGFKSLNHRSSAERLHTQWRQRLRPRVALFPIMSQSTESSKQLVKRPASPLSTPQFVASNKLTAALYEIFSKKDKADNILSTVLADDVKWSSPLFDKQSRQDVCASLDQFLSFADEPTIVVYTVSQDKDSDGYSFEWTLSFLYPLPWRPRVALSSTTHVNVRSDGLVIAITDDWYVPPFNIIQQTLPRLKDIFWFFPAPPPETDMGSRRKLKSTRDYMVIEQAPRAEIHILGEVQQNERDLIYVTPALPEDVFEGDLRRLEFYSTVSPLAIRHFSGDDFEWVLPVPGAHAGSSNVLLPAPKSRDVTVRSEGRRVFAVHRFRGFSTRTETEKHLKKFMKALRADGLWEGDILSNDVWIRLYDISVGFNSKGLLAMAMYSNSRGVPRVNELAIDITDRWHEQQ